MMVEQKKFIEQCKKNFMSAIKNWQVKSCFICGGWKSTYDYTCISRDEYRGRHSSNLG